MYVHKHLVNKSCITHVLYVIWIEMFGLWTFVCSNPRAFNVGQFIAIDQKKPHHTFTSWAEKYGPIFSIKFGFIKQVVINFQEIANEVLYNASKTWHDLEELSISLNGWSLVITRFFLLGFWNSNCSWSSSKASLKF